MLSQQPQPKSNGWQALPGVSQEMLQPLRLNPGQALHDRDHLPPGVLLIEQGDMQSAFFLARRLLASGETWAEPWLEKIQAEMK